MNKVLSLLLLIGLTGCGTVGGTMSGMAKDLTKAGEWISNK